MCGVVGVIHPVQSGDCKNAAADVYRGLLTLQHRGQDAAGIVSFDSKKNRFHLHKDIGLAGTVFTQEKITVMDGPYSLGHTRYETVGSDNLEDIQPLVTGVPFGIALAHNGNLLNYHSIKKFINDDLQLQLLTNNDVEQLLILLGEGLRIAQAQNKQSDFFDNLAFSVNALMEKVIGAYAVIGICANRGMFAFRDPEGIRPLVLGVRQNENGESSYCFASETLTLNFLGFEYVRDVKGGELVFIDEKQQLRSIQIKEKKSAHCMFEWIYFSSAESAIEGINVYSQRLKLGNLLANRIMKEKSDILKLIDIVSPVPDTSRTAAIALGESLKIPYREALIKNRYIQRSFILNTQEKREKAVELKLSPVRSEIEGKSILLVDDSIVRGTTSKQIIKLLKKFGARKIYLAITCPPIRKGCFYGIDFPNEDVLLAHNKNEKEIAQWIGADDVFYLTENDLTSSFESLEVCMGCVNGKYPTNSDEAIEFASKRI